MSDQEKEDFKNQIKKEMEEKRPKLLPLLDTICESIFKVVKTKNEAQAFWKGYSS